VVHESCQAFHGNEFVSSSESTVTIRGAQSQTPRLLLIPLIEKLVNEHLRFAYSKTIARYLSCGFFGGSGSMYSCSGESQSAVVKSNVSFEDTKVLLRASKNTSFLSLPEYWRVYAEFKGPNSAIMTSLADKTFVELLDTTITNESKIKNGNDPVITLNIAKAPPALIQAEDGDRVTGIPVKLIYPKNRKRFKLNGGVRAQEQT